MVQGALPAAVKLQLPPAFHGKMDGTSVLKFIHQLDIYWSDAQGTDLVGVYTD